MVQMYTIAGRQIASHHLAIATLGSVFGGIFLYQSTKKPAPATPPIDASSQDEADFIQKFIADAEAETKKEKH